MTKFAEHFDFTGDLFKCKMTFKSERPVRKSTFGLAFQLNVFSEKMATHFNNNDDKMFLLQNEMYNVEDKVTVAGVNDYASINILIIIF